MQEHPLQDSMMSQGLTQSNHNSTYPRDTDQLQSGARNGSKEVAATSSSACRSRCAVASGSFLLDTQRPFAQVEQLATDTAAEGEPGAVAETDFGQTDFGHPYFPTLAKSDFGQTDFG